MKQLQCIWDDSDGRDDGKDIGGCNDGNTRAMAPAIAMAVMAVTIVMAGRCLVAVSNGG